MLIRIRDVITRTGCPRSTLYLRISQGLFTRPVRIGVRAVAWPIHEIDAILKAWVAGYTEAQMGALVCKLEADRKTVKKS